MIKQIKKETGYVTSFDSTPIYYEVRGEGKPIFLAYGIVCLINHWHHQIKYFSENYQTIVIDYRGHHMSGTPSNPENMSLDAIARDIIAVCDHLGIDKASFFAHSFGAQCLLRTYDLRPELFENIVFINSFATNPLKGMFGIENMDQVFRFLKQGYEQLPETLNYFWKSAIDNPFALQLMGLSGGFNIKLTSLKDIQVYLRGVKNIDLNVFLSLFEHMLNYDGNAVLSDVKVPTLIIGGSQDNVTPVHFQELMHQKIKGSVLQIIPYGSHCSQLDMPDLVNLRIEKFLRSINY